eukprot:401873_1
MSQLYIVLMLLLFYVLYSNGQCDFKIYSLSDPGSTAAINGYTVMNYADFQNTSPMKQEFVTFMNGNNNQITPLATFTATNIGQGKSRTSFGDNGQIAWAGTYYLGVVEPQCSQTIYFNAGSRYNLCYLNVVTPSMTDVWAVHSSTSNTNDVAFWYKCPTSPPTQYPTFHPSQTPSQNPSMTPTQNPSLTPTQTPSLNPLQILTITPTKNPLIPNPTINPSFN